MCSEWPARKRARFGRVQTSTTSVSPVDYGGPVEHADSVVQSMLRSKHDEAAKEIDDLHTALNAAYETISNFMNKIVSMEPSRQVQ